MKRRGIRFRISPDGALGVVDPDPSALEVMRAIDPTFAVRSSPLEEFDGPRLALARTLPAGVSASALARLPTETLWRRHATLLRRMRRGACGSLREGDASMLDLKVELARRALKTCGLCRSRCGVNRLEGQIGNCGLGPEAYVGEHFLHIAEEGPINPSYNMSLQGCAMRCRYCQQFALLPIRPRVGRRLDASLWGDMNLSGARSLSFVGGNPDESLAAILDFLRVVPKDFTLPIVWNCHGFAERVALTLLDGVVDVYVPDFKYGSDECARRWSGVEGYVAAASKNVGRMVGQRANVFVRMLVLPGHFDCCHAPALRVLSRHRGRLRVNVLGQYCPDWKVRERDGEMGHRVTEDEVRAARAYALSLGLGLVE
jgi:putative pyruvate formate lyase activating enzyme